MRTAQHVDSVKDIQVMFGEVGIRLFSSHSMLSNSSIGDVSAALAGSLEEVQRSDVHA
jgi:hypothetical protein